MHPIEAPIKSELGNLTHRISQRVAGFLEREGLLVRDMDNGYLALDGLEDDPMLQIRWYSIIYRIATGKQQEQKVFTLQTIAKDCKGLHLWQSKRLCQAVPLYYPPQGIRKTVSNDNLQQG